MNKNLKWVTEWDKPKFIDRELKYVLLLIFAIMLFIFCFSIHVLIVHKIPHGLLGLALPIGMFITVLIEACDEYNEKILKWKENL